MSDVPHFLGYTAAAPWPRGLGETARPAPFGPARRALPNGPGEVVPLAPPLRIGVVSNPRSHRNKMQHGAQLGRVDEALHAAPRTPDELAETLAFFAARGVTLLVVDGGDGTVRDVLTAARGAFARAPRLAVVPSGKTNALAIDLGIAPDATLPDVIAAARAGRWVSRSPIDIHRDGAALPALRGFLFGSGAFVRATALAQRTHRWGAFNGMAVGLSLAWGVAQTMFAGAANPWRAGEPLRLTLPDGTVDEHASYMTFASTMERLPLGLKPLGPSRAGLKLLAIGAPPRALLRRLPALLRGSDDPALERDGYRRREGEAFGLVLEGDFTFDGETYRGGALELRRGAPIHFAVP